MNWFFWAVGLRVASAACSHPCIDLHFPTGFTDDYVVVMEFSRGDVAVKNGNDRLGIKKDGSDIASSISCSDMLRDGRTRVVDNKLWSYFVLETTTPFVAGSEYKLTVPDCFQTVNDETAVDYIHSEITVPAVPALDDTNPVTSTNMKKIAKPHIVGTGAPVNYDGAYVAADTFEILFDEIVSAGAGGVRMNSNDITSDQTSIVKNVVTIQATLEQGKVNTIELEADFVKDSAGNAFCPGDADRSITLKKSTVFAPINLPNGGSHAAGMYPPQNSSASKHSNLFLNFADAISKSESGGQIDLCTSGCSRLLDSAFCVTRGSLLACRTEFENGESYNLTIPSTLLDYYGGLNCEEYSCESNYGYAFSIDPTASDKPELVYETFGLHQRSYASVDTTFEMFFTTPVPVSRSGDR